jgi:hypothetical protein
MEATRTSQLASKEFMHSSHPNLSTGACAIRVILAFLVFTSAGHASAQQAKPNLTGTWKLNASKSKLAPQHERGIDLYKIKHSEPRVEMLHMFDGRSEPYFYLTDGKERIANRSEQDGDLRAKTYWDGDTLVIEKHQELGPGSGTVWTSRYTLSQDGQSLIVTQHFKKSSIGSVPDEYLVYEKQR